MSWSRGSGRKKASGERMGSPRISRRLFPSGLPFLKNSSWAPGWATTLNVGFGMYSEMRALMANLSRPLTCTSLTRLLYSAGRYRVKASGCSYMWLSASKTGKSSRCATVAPLVVMGVVSWSRSGVPR